MELRTRKIFGKSLEMFGCLLDMIRPSKNTPGAVWIKILCVTRDPPKVFDIIHTFWTSLVVGFNIATIFVDIIAAARSNHDSGNNDPTGFYGFQVSK